ncbi:MAG: BTAD domain-containing putative transcriptional regulator [Paracoccus sp. (in: a-proteobacteria)]|uniref:AfsR/SARP family transcriptional regulator n=1 Tax=Paracoccus sp. TaxID=267 RepID=UPI0039E40387
MPLLQGLLDVLDALRLRKGRALLFFLMVDGARSHRTEKIADLLWQDSDEQKASASYRQAVKHIRRAMEEVPGPSLDTSMGEIALCLPRRFLLQEELAALIAAPDFTEQTGARARRLIDTAQQLEGISASFDSWLAITRAKILAALRQSLDDRLAQLAGDDGARRRMAEFAVQLEPANESAARLLMRLDWQAGKPTRAIERYNALYAHLDEAFDQEPEAETVELLAAIKLDPTGGARHPAQIEREPQVTLSVQMMPGAGDGGPLEALAGVVFADLRMRLGRFREWRVVDDGTEAPQVRILLRPFFLSGTLRLFAEVQRGAGGHLVWSEWIDEPQTDWEHKARMLLSNIAGALSVVVSDRSLADPGVGIYDDWLRAQALLDDWSHETEGEALAILREITARAPRFGPAHAELAGALNVRHVLLPGTFQTDDLRRDAMHHAIVAVSADPMDTRAHRVLAWCFCHMGYFDLADFHFDQALNLNRSNMLTLVSAALGFSFTGDLAKAAALVAEAKSHAPAMEPFHQIYLAAADYLLGNHEAAARQCEKGAGLMPTAGGWHAAALWRMGRTKEAALRLDAYLAELRRSWHGPPKPGDADLLDWFLSAFPLRHENWREDLRQVLDQVDQARGLIRH